MDKKTVFTEGLILPRALKVLSDSVLVAEPSEGVAPARHERRSQGRREGTGVRQLLRRRARRRRAQPERLPVGDGQLDAHVGRHDVLPAEERQGRDSPDALARAVGPDAGRLRARLSQLEQLGARHRLHPTPYFVRNPEPRAHAWQLRVRRRSGRAQPHVSHSIELRRQPRLSAPASCGPRTERWRPTPASARRRCSGAIDCRPISGATSSWPNPPATSSAASCCSDDGTRLQAHEGV